MLKSSDKLWQALIPMENESDRKVFRESNEVNAKQE